MPALDSLPKKTRKGWKPRSGGEPGKQIMEKIGVSGGSQGRIKVRLGKVTEEAIR